MIQQWKPKQGACKGHEENVGGGGEGTKEEKDDGVPNAEVVKLGSRVEDDEGDGNRMMMKWRQ